MCNLRCLFVMCFSDKVYLLFIYFCVWINGKSKCLSHSWQYGWLIAQCSNWKLLLSVLFLTFWLQFRYTELILHCHHAHDWISDLCNNSNEIRIEKWSVHSNFCYCICGIHHNRACYCYVKTLGGAWNGVASGWVLQYFFDHSFYPWVENMKYLFLRDMMSPSLCKFKEHPLLMFSLRNSLFHINWQWIRLTWLS